MEKPKIIYLAGRITGAPRFREKFQSAARELTLAGYIVVNPAVLPDGLPYSMCIHISTAMLDVCDAICLLPDWTRSPGAQLEYSRAKLCGKEILFYREAIKQPAAT